MKILITGGRGMVGRNLREHAMAVDYEIIAPTRQECNLLDQRDVDAWVAKIKPDAIIHTAGLVGGIIANMTGQVEFLAQNFDMGKNLVLAARANKIKKFINLGSSCIYPKSAPQPLQEKSMLTGAFEPTNEGYALAKMAVLKLCQFIHTEDKTMQYKTLIPPNLYGRYDNFDPINSHFPAAVIAKLHHAKLNQLSKVKIWGDGQARRELMSAIDLAKAIWFALKYIDQLPAITNVGVNHDFTIMDYYQAAAKVINWHGKFFHDLTRPVGMQQKLMDSQFFATLGFKPEITLEQGITIAYDYYCQEILTKK